MNNGRLLVTLLCLALSTVCVLVTPCAFTWLMAGWSSGIAFCTVVDEWTVGREEK